jgi:branched-chain amino acid transport system ATP-binding protein
MSGPLLHVEGLRSGYGDSQVLHGLDLQVPEGQVVAVLGRNGTGKTTFMHTMMGLVPRTAGRILLGGVDVSGLPTHEVARRGLRIVPQGRRVFTSLTVEENLRVAVSRRDPGPWNIQRIYDTLPSLYARRANRADRLSGGEQEMLSIARALLGNPKVLLLDEPSDGLAPKVVETVGEILAGLRGEGLSAVLVEQNLKLAVTASDVVCCLVRGQIVWRGSTDEFRRRPDIAARYVGAVVDGAGAAPHPDGEGNPAVDARAH